MKNVFRLLGALALVVSFIFHSGEPDSAKWAMAVVALTMACWWIFEVAPLGIVALLPLVAFPLLGITGTGSVAPMYMNSTLFVFMGGFFVALAMRQSNLHRRIALRIIAFFGNAPSRIILGFMSATFFLSMWISNTATAVMMVSVGLAVISNLDELPISEKMRKRISTCLMLSIAYSASVGGMATLVGTPPNLAFGRIYSMNFPDLPVFSFSDWLFLGLPCALLVFLVIFAVLYVGYLRGLSSNGLSIKTIKEELKAMGSPSRDEKYVAVVFCLMAFLWIFRKPLQISFLHIPGWSTLLPVGHFVDDGTVAVLCSLILFFIPSIMKDKGRDKILVRADINRIPWETILLFGGGFALARGMSDSGLSDYLAGQLEAVGDLPLPVTMASLTAGMSLLTELTSNTASTELVLPVLFSMSKNFDVNPFYLTVPTTLAASCAFMLPAATPPNATIFASGKVTIAQMVKTGVVINVVSILIVTLWCYWII